MAAVTFARAVVAIVQQDDIPSAGAAQARNDRFGRLRLPIPGSDGPHHHARATVPSADDGIELRSPEPIGRAQPLRAVADGQSESIVAAVEFRGNAPGRKKNQPGMCIGMVPDHMSARGNFFREVRECADALANKKEGSLGMVAVQQIEKRRSNGWVWTIIEREGHGGCVAGASNRGAEKL